MDVYEALDHGNERGQGQERDHGFEKQRMRSGAGQQGCDTQAQDALGSLSDSHFAVKAQTLGPGPGIGYQKRAENGDHAQDDGGNTVGDVGGGEQESSYTN